MSRFLVVTWDGAGNLVPTLGIARALVEAGHEVRLLGHPSVDERFGRHGWSFRPFSSAPDYDAVHPGDLAQEMPFLVENVFFGEAVARDTLAEIDRTATDAVLVDALMLSALCATEVSGVPSAALMHCAYCLVRHGPLLDLVSAALPLLSAVRAGLGIEAIAGIPELHDRCDLLLVSSLREFEPPGDVGLNATFIGPILDGPQPLATEPAPPVDAGRDPLVLLSFSTSQMGQATVLQRVLDATATLPVQVLVTTGPAVDRHALRVPANATVLSQVPHAPILRQASLVVTHAGLGTVMASLAAGVPLLCMPMGRDQFFNAQRVTDLGAGRVIGDDAETEVIAEAVSAVLADSALADRARQFARTVADYPGAAGAVAVLERLATRQQRTP